LKNAPILVIALAVALPVAGAPAGKWKQLAKNKEAELWIDQGSLIRNDGETAFDYRIDYAKTQKEVGTGTPYRSTLTRAIVRCASRTMSMGPSTAYAGRRATGKVVGKYPPSPEEARFQPVEPGSSDENLWRHICEVAQVVPNR